MSRALAIFRKDARHLWPHIAVFLTLLALAALLDPTYTSRDPLAYSLFSSLLPLACWSLIIAAIHEEKLPGDRQYWLTRPFSWKDLLGAKALFVVAFINLPMLVCHAAILSAVGVPLLEHFPALLWRQVFFVAFYILPVAALAAISRNIGQLILTALLIVLPIALRQGFLFARFRLHWGDSGWMLTSAVALVLAAGVAAILAIQYSGRRTALARVTAAAVACAVLGVTFIPARGSPRTDSVRISLDSRRGRPADSQTTGSDSVAIEIPVRVDGIPAGADLVKNRMTLRIEGSDRRAWRPISVEGGLHEVANGAGWLGTSMDRKIFLYLQNSSLTMSGTLDFTLFVQAQVLPVPRDRRVVAPRIGVCSHAVDSSGTISIVCYTPFPQASLYLGKPGRGANWIVARGFAGAPLPTEAGFQPLTKFSTQLPFASWNDIGDAQLIAGRPLAHVEVPFEFRGIKLADYAARR